ncbi:MAG: hypothetical protein K8H84_07330 [Sulfuricella denitrificans]|nr:hypothetical protein [Sulfuricella denitrificans]
MTEITQSEFAKLMGYAKSTVTKMKQEGRLVMTDAGLVDVEASVARIDALASPSAHHRAHAQQLQEDRDAKQNGKQPEQDAPAESIEALNLRLKKAEANKREHEEAITKIELLAKEKSYLPAESVSFAVKDYMARLGDLLDGMPDRKAAVLFPIQTLDEMHAALVEMFEDIRAQMHEGQKRVMEISRGEN